MIYNFCRKERIEGPKNIDLSVYNKNNARLLLKTFIYFCSYGSVIP